MQLLLLTPCSISFTFRKASSRLGNGDLSGKLEEVLTNSPDIGEFSEDEEKDAHREQIAMTNHKLIEIRKKKLEYRAKHKIVKGGLFEVS